MALTTLDRQEVDCFTRTFEELFYQGDAATMTAFYAEDAEIMAPGSEPVRGRHAIEAFWKAASQAAQQTGPGRGGTPPASSAARSARSWSAVARRSSTGSPRSPRRTDRTGRSAAASRCGWSARAPGKARATSSSTTRSAARKREAGKQDPESDSMRAGRRSGRRRRATGARRSRTWWPSAVNAWCTAPRSCSCTARGRMPWSRRGGRATGSPLEATWPEGACASAASSGAVYRPSHRP